LALTNTTIVLANRKVTTLSKFSFESEDHEFDNEEKRGVGGLDDPEDIALKYLGNKVCFFELNLSPRSPL
jgi:hypothetical protein